MSTVSKETMDFISQMREAEKAKVKVPVKPVAPVPPPVVFKEAKPVRRAGLLKPFWLARVLATTVFLFSIIAWLPISCFPMTAPGTSTLNIGLIADREMLLMTDAALFVVSGVFMAAHTIMRTINAATVVMVERLAGNGK